ncbi:hypothetical protein [Bremerella alba]|uniref:Carboxypeptidase regulatory-like domain-containing protein n=1 Tax=Bremerella alba TaxID=980252 RepID=A0A7V8V166_9BACT|nr:hypothetical protein [Bremerella alba]MBA2113043.1 hypothetical protein [Bremerella alba]
MRSLTFNHVGLATACCLMFAGCTAQQSATAPVQGSVTHNGEPVGLGQVVFQPVSAEDKNYPGKPARATVQPDGNYTLTTFDEGDGALLGKHRVTFELGPQPAGEYRDGKQHPPSPEEVKQWRALRGLVSDTQEVEVVSGKNSIDLELVKR